MYRRNLEWQVTEAPSRDYFPRPQYLHVLSIDGRFSIRALVVSEYSGFDRYKNAWYTHRYWWEGDPMSIIRDVEVLGTEFPLGCEYEKAGFDFERGHMCAKYGIVHTELVRACIEHWSHRRRFRPKKKLQPGNPISN
jgi:hypothetical protein